MDRFIKTLSVLIIMLFILASGIDVTLDRLAASPRQSQLSIYGERNSAPQVYTGNLARLAEAGKMDTNGMPHLLRRAKTPILPDSGYRWL